MHKKTNSLLIVYVDDFRMAAKAEYTPRLWDEIRVKLVTDEPSPPQRFLGVVQHYFEEPVEKLGYFLDHNPRVRGREAEVQKFVPKNPKLLVRGYRYQMADFFGKAVDKYCAVSNIERSTLKKVATPFVDESQERQGCLEPANPADDKEVGKLATTACSILMTNMFGARASRWDLLRPTAGLATFIHKWTPNSDKRLHRLMQYVNCRLDDSAVGFVGDPPSEWYLALFADADFAGCRTTMKSTGGVFLVLMGPNTFHAADGLVEEAWVRVRLQHRGGGCHARHCSSHDRHSCFRSLGRVAWQEGGAGHFRRQPGHQNHSLDGKVREGYGSRPAVPWGTADDRDREVKRWYVYHRGLPYGEYGR